MVPYYHGCKQKPDALTQATQVICDLPSDEIDVTLLALV